VHMHVGGRVCTTAIGGYGLYHKMVHPLGALLLCQNAYAK